MRTIDLRKLSLVALVGAGCAGATMTPEQKMVHELFVEAGAARPLYPSLVIDEVTPRP